jgi:hypothetical protein
MEKAIFDGAREVPGSTNLWVSDRLSVGPCRRPTGKPAKGSTRVWSAYLAPRRKGAFVGPTRIYTTIAIADGLSGEMGSEDALGREWGSSRHAISKVIREFLARRIQGSETEADLRHFPDIVKMG